METAGAPGLLVLWETWEPSLGLPITVAPSLVSLEWQFVAGVGGTQICKLSSSSLARVPCLSTVRSAGLFHCIIFDRPF